LKFASNPIDQFLNIQKHVSEYLRALNPSTIYDLWFKKRINNRFSVIGEASLFRVFDNRFKSSGDFIYQGGLGFVFDF